MDSVPQDKNPSKVGFDFKSNAKTIDGVAFDTYEMTTKFDPNDPKAAQAQQMMAMVYGPNGIERRIWGRR